MYEPRSIMRSLPELWNKCEIQLMVLLSFMLQMFLLLTGRMRCRNINGLLRALIWLSYVGADFVAIFALGLFSYYGERLRSHSFGDTLPFLWIPFLLMHLGVQDSITAFSIEDNNLWLRHLLNLGVQGSLALYTFWKSIQSIHREILVPAALVFFSGIIKYGERIWALRSGSRDGLGKSSLKSEQLVKNNPSNRSISLYALQTVLCARGLLIGRTVLQLGDGIKKQIVNEFEAYGSGDRVKLKIIMTELDMLFDILYTKAIVLQSQAGRILRYAGQISMVTAFVLFLRWERIHARNHNRANVAISYILFTGAILMEGFSVAMVIASPWTRAHLKGGAFLPLFFTSSNASSGFMSDERRKVMEWVNKIVEWPAPNFIGQHNHWYFISNVTRSKVICKVISVLGLAGHWKNLWYVNYVDCEKILDDIVEWFDRSPDDLFEQRQLYNRRLNYTLCLPFEHVLYRLHIFTDLHISRHFDVRGQNYSANVMRLKEDCEKLSNYMYYLMLVHPSMLPISIRAYDGTLNPGEEQARSKLEVLNNDVNEFARDVDSACPFDPAETEAALKQSLDHIKELWLRLLVYAAGKCSAELHARQLGDGGELLTFVWLLMLHRGLGDAATEVNILVSNDPSLPELGSLVPASGPNYRRRPEEPRYAFDFRHHVHDVARE